MLPTTMIIRPREQSSHDIAKARRPFRIYPMPVVYGQQDDDYDFSDLMDLDEDQQFAQVLELSRKTVQPTVPNSSRVGLRDTAKRQPC